MTRDPFHQGRSSISHQHYLNVSFWHYLFIIITIVTIITIFVVNILIIMIMIVITTCSKTCEVLLAIVGVWKPVVVPKAQHAANIRIRIIFDE